MNDNIPLTLHYRSEPLGRSIDRAHLQSLLEKYPGALLSLEPAIALPCIDGRIQSGRHPRFQPLSHDLPPEGLVVQEAALYAERTWIILAAPQAASGWKGRQLVWSLDELGQATKLDGITCKTGKALAWRDRKRFGLPAEEPETNHRTERFYRGAELITWRIVPPHQGA